MKRHALLLATLLLLAGAAAAHDGEPHAATTAAPESPAGPRIRWETPDTLFVPKALQRRLGIRTASSTATERAAIGEVIADPASRGMLSAAQPGRLETASRWPLVGQVFAAGEVLAWLHPLRNLQEETRLRTELVQSEQALKVARINVDRLRVQAGAADGVVTTGNVYREQAELDLTLAEERHRLARAALQHRVAIRAPFGGVLSSAAAQDGEIVATGQPLFEIADPRRSWLAVITDDPHLGVRLQGASLRLDGRRVPLNVRGVEPLAGKAGWRLLLSIEADATTPAPLRPGELLSVSLQINATRVAPADACVAEARGGSVWVHVAAERFARRRLPACVTLPAAADERWVTQGAALLAQYQP